MFNNFESADSKKREAVMNRRLMMLRCARERGYFDEAGSEPMPKVVADGVGPDDLSEALVSAYKRQRLIEGVGQTETAKLWERIADDEERMSRAFSAAYAERILDAVDRVCPECAGFCGRLNDDGDVVGMCPACDGMGVVDDGYAYRNPHSRPEDKPTCPHQNTCHWFGGHKLCLDCGERIGE